VFLKVVLRQVSDYIFNVLVSDEARFKLTRERDLAAPAEPDARVFVERRPQRYFEPARACGTVARNRNAVRNDEESCQERSPEHREPITPIECTKIFLPRIRVFAAGEDGELMSAFGDQSASKLPIGKSIEILAVGARPDWNIADQYAQYLKAKG